MEKKCYEYLTLKFSPFMNIALTARSSKCFKIDIFFRTILQNMTSKLIFDILLSIVDISWLIQLSKLTPHD